MYKLRVVLSPKDIQKVSLEQRPDSVENLMETLKDKLSLEGSFTLQYADPDFGGEMVNLTNANDLPETCASVHVIYTEIAEDQCYRSSTPSLSSVGSFGSSHDTMSVSSNDDIQSVEAKLRQGCWPEVFQVPKVGPELELVFEDGNRKYLSEGKKLDLSKDHKSQFLDAIANRIWEYKAYPTHMEYTEVAKAIMRTYPCLAEKGSSSGYDEMLNSIKFKMGNLRAKMRKLDCIELNVNSRKRSYPGTSSSKHKKPKRAEINYLPDIPIGEDATSMEFYRENICAEVQKRNRDMNKIKNMMMRTYAYRRQDLVLKAPAVNEMVERWPALFLPSELKAEFSRLSNLALESTFFSSLDQHLDRMVEILSTRQKFQNLFHFETGDVTAKRTAVLRCIPDYFTEQPYFKDFEDTTMAEDIQTEVTHGIAVLGDVKDPLSICIVVDNKIVIDDIKYFPSAVALFFAIHYCLHLEYAKGQERTMELIQKVFFGLNGRKLTAKLQSFKNKLFS
ncbi:uncharacterized protein [Apostichopus japonicus]